MDINFIQIFILIVQGILLAALILFLFNLRKKWGYGLLYACLGLFQFLQGFLSSTIYVKISENIIVTPGSSLFFTISIFAILIMYIKDDATETRKIIYALLVSNAVMALLLISLKININNAELYNPFNIPPDFFNYNARFLFFGTLTLVADAILIIILFEFISRFIRSIFLRIVITMLIVVSFDSVFYNLLAFSDYDQVKKIFLSGLLSKSLAALLYSFIFTIYIKNFEKGDSQVSANKFKDIFTTLSYRQKYEQANQEKKIIQEEAENAILISESKYKTLTKISPVGIFLTDKDGKTIFVNPKWCEITGLTGEEAMGFGWHKSLHENDRDFLLGKWDSATLKNKANYEEFRFIMPDKSEKWVLGQAVPDYDPSGEIIGFVGTITDITELKKYENELTILKDKAEESDKLKSAFLANMSHEIRTPMNGILGFTELLKDPDSSNVEKAEYLELIEISGLRMMDIINNVVDISKIESGLAEVSAEEANIHKICNDIFSFFENEAKEKGLEFILKKPQENKSKTFLIDRNKTISSLTNLIKNAIKYTDAGKIEFGYNIVELANKKHFKFYVTDTGIGIPKHRQDAVFKRFVQADIADKFAKQGAGLGLSIAKAYVEMMNGSISLESTEGKGSEFTFTIPCIETDRKSTEHTKIIPKSDTFKPGIKVLIAEDDLNSFLIYSSYLKDYEWEIMHVNTGVEAVEVARKNSDLDLILMDIKMPLMDGYTASKMIREFMPNVIIIAQSAFTFDPDKDKNEYSFNQYINKPIDKKSFISVLGQYFGS